MEDEEVEEDDKSASVSADEEEENACGGLKKFPSVGGAGCNSSAFSKSSRVPRSKVSSSSFSGHRR